ncbi:MAG: hypothetical protein H0T42_05410 [Deltaproteobacteria bacterium]|nr:hypothetical protein [Deltaproteobacteria bacterium]
MTLDVIALGYAAIGVAVAIGLAIAGRRPTAGDVLLLTAVWPLAGPMILFGDRERCDDHELVSALARASASPLASILPDAETARVLQARLREASARLADLEDVLARPDFDPAAAQRRASELTARGATAAAATAGLRVRTLGQLRELRERYRRELDEVRELMAQLVTQAELVRLQPSIAQASSELVRELVDRVEGLGDLFAYQASLEYEPSPDRSA